MGGGWGKGEVGLPPWEGWGELMGGGRGVGEVRISKGQDGGGSLCPGPGDTFFPLAAQQQQ